ncbi:centrosomin isoform X2 [Anopheles stephensi]|uniref:centrosomin isoform X2 n=1 Tax=Anopheles stephensi TaxID=30069 RepID=UPI001658767F|nr:centrosomin isoform X2 [Anopheles stephensi]XP_035903929.1 centrosomin isoform X2 [Anopheles stephensi]XP_035903930.1 centrosomin isoform X2 [Anopheles stephensi]
MSGIFKYTPNRTAASTPNRRSAFGTGFGSPGVHQDATMDNSYAMGFRSPSINALTGHGSPVPVRSLRDNEEEISTLRKENFNLKLRIYFLEQKAGICTDSDTPVLGVTSSSSTNTSCDGNYLKQNIDLKVEVESLRQDVQNKHDLLCQAAKAMEVMEESHKKAEEKHREMVNDLNNRIEMHQLEIKSLEKMASELQHQYRELQLSTSRAGLEDDGVNEHAGDMTSSVAGGKGTVRDNVGESLLNFLDTVQQHSELSVQEKLKLLEMDNAVRQCQERNEELSRQVEQLQAMIDEKTSKISQLEVELGELRFENAELREESEKPQNNVEIERLKQQNFDIRSELAEKLCVLDDTEAKLREKTMECTKSCKMVEKLIKTITEQDKELEKLKRNSPIELNNSREPPIRKNISLASEHGSFPAAPVEIVDQDRKPVSQSEYDALVQRAKLLQHKNDTLIHKLCGGNGSGTANGGGGGGDNRNDRNIIIKQLNDELIKAREEAEKEQRWRKETADLCAISTHRLEELAGFLDSLLRNKELLGSLSTDSRKAIRNAVDRSLDLSRSLNMSISVTGLSLIGNNSLAQLSCLSGYLDHSIGGDVGGGQKKQAGDGSDDAEEYDKENRVSNVKGQTISGSSSSTFGGLNQTKQMIESLRAENKALRGELMEQQQQQRPRRRESKERKSVPIEPISDSEAWSEPDRGVSMARIGLEDSKLTVRQKNASAGTIAAMNLSASGALELSSTSDNESLVTAAQRKSGSSGEMKHLQEMVASLNKDLQDKNGTILTIQSQLVDLDSELQRERTRLANVQSEATEHRQQWEREANESRAKAERMAERLALLEGDIRQRDALIEKLRKEREQAAVDLRVAVMKLESMHTEYSDLQQRHKRELDARLAHEQRQLEELRQSLTESFRNELQLKQQSFDTALAQNYISKNIHQEKVRELNELHYRLEDAHNDLSAMAQTEDALRKQLADCERNVLAMKKSLDEATLQASKAAIDRTKALNEKRQLESELGYAQDELKQLKVEKNQLNEQLQAVMMRSPRTAGASGGRRMVGQDGNLSTSGTDEETAGRRQLENSSPDLGIESDPGRLSNVELGGELKYATSPQQRPLLKTLELTKSMSNLLLNPAMDVKLEDGESSKGAGGEQESPEATTIVKHDCAKIEVDYRDLQRRYNKTRHCLAVAYDKIKSSNRVKKQLEVDLKQQIHKTHAVLKTVHRNMDSNGGGSNDD